MGIISLTAAAGWTGFLLVLFNLPPCEAPGTITLCHSVSAPALALVFLSAGFALTATLTLSGFGLRYWLHRDEIYLDHLSVSLRQGIMLTLSVLGAFALLLLNTLTWWSGLMLIGIILLLELYFTRGT